MSFDTQLPDGWSWTTLDAVKAEGKSVVSGPFGSNIGKRFFVESGIPVIRGSNLTLGMERFIDDGFVYLTEEKALEFRNCEAWPGDLVFTAAGTIGQVGIIPRTPRFEKYIISNKQLRVRVNEKRIVPLFAYYWFASPDMVSTIQSRNTGSTIPLINLSVAKSLPIPLPPIEVQAGIVDILSALDDRIALLRETNATLEAMAQALFKSWFVDFDPVHANAGTRAATLPAELQALFPSTFTDTPQGPVPEGWEIATLGAICRNNGGFIQTGPFGSQLHASDYVQDGIPVVMPKDISNRRVDPNFAAKIKNSDALRLEKHQLQAGDIVFSRRGDVEKHALIGKQESGWLCGTGCLLVRPGKTWISSAFLSRALDLPKTREWLVRHAVGATMPNLNTSILDAVPMLMPESKLLIAFEKVVSEFDHAISNNYEQTQTLATLRDTLLPRLISGQLRLPDAEAALAEAGA